MVKVSIEKSAPPAVDPNEALDDKAYLLSSLVASGDCGCDGTLAVESEVTLATSEEAPIPEGAKVAKWEGAIGFETVITGDGRYINDQALRWSTPIPLRYVREDVGAHDNAVVVGTITSIERREGGVIWGSGVIDLESEMGQEAYRQVDRKYTNGVSMDLDDVTFELHVAQEVIEEMQSMFDEGSDAMPEFDIADDGKAIVGRMAPDDEVSVTTDARIRAATIVAIPAFADAVISIVASGFLYGYNPSQARAPKGTPRGGQWVDTPSGILAGIGGGSTPFDGGGLGGVVDKVAENGGASINPVTLEEPTDGYMVAVQGFNEEVPEGDFFGGQGEEALYQWIEKNIEPLSQLGAHIGLWHDTEHGEVVLDVSQRVDTLDEAVALGIERNQQAVWDVANAVEIPTGGTGDRAGDFAGRRLARYRRAPGGLRGLGRGAQARVRAGVDRASGRSDRLTDYYYNPEQARAPKGSPIGGQWIDTPTGLLTLLQKVRKQTTELPPLAQDHTSLKPDAADVNGRPYGEDVVEATNAVHYAAIKYEPGITSDFQAAVAENGVADDMTYLEYRVKAPPSLATKIRSKSSAPDVTAEMAASEVHDAIRYTVQSSEADYATSVDSTLEALRAKGYDVVEVKDFWRDPALSNLAYKGVNTKVVSPDGVKIELQFHTSASQKVKDGLHVLYDQQKLVEPGSPEFAAIEDQMVRLVEESGLRMPDGYDTM